MASRILMFVAAAMVSAPALAQVPARVNDYRGGPPVTPMQWRHEWLAEPKTSWDYVARKGRPLVMNLPGSPSTAANGLSSYMWRLFYDEGYALGQLVWHDDRARTQSVRYAIEQIRSQVSEVRADPARFGGFDPNRMIIAAWGDDAFPAALVALDSGPRASSPVCAAIFIDAKNLEPASPESVTATRRFSEYSNSAELSATRYAANAPPTLLMTEVFDTNAARRSDALAESIQAAGGTAVRATFSRFDERDPRTYLGYSEDPSTEVISEFVKDHCPAKDSRGAQP